MYHAYTVTQGKWALGQCSVPLLCWSLLHWDLNSLVAPVPCSTPQIGFSEKAAESWGDQWWWGAHNTAAAKKIGASVAGGDSSDSSSECCAGPPLGVAVVVVAVAAVAVVVVVVVVVPSRCSFVHDAAMWVVVAIK